MRRATRIIGILLLIAAAARAEDADRRIENLFNQFMPPCCYTGLLKDHQSGAAEEMKEEIRTLVHEGKSDQEIKDHFVAIHGERILADPPEEGFNRLAVITPVAILIAGFLFVGMILRKQKGKGKRRSGRPAGIDPAMDDEIEREIREGW